MKHETLKRWLDVYYTANLSLSKISCFVGGGYGFPATIAESKSDSVFGDFNQIQNLGGSGFDSNPIFGVSPIDLFDDLPNFWYTYTRGPP